MHKTAAAVGAAVLAAAAVTGAAPAPAEASGAQHVFVPEEFDGTEHFDAGAGPCVGWAGTFHEVRHGGYRIVVAPGGRVAGEAHANGTVDGLVELTPDDPALPSYRGSYQEKNVVVLTDPTSDDGGLRVGHFALLTKLAGSDGSTLWLGTSGHVTLDAQGRVVVARDRFTCR